MRLVRFIYFLGFCVRVQNNIPISTRHATSKGYVSLILLITFVIFVLTLSSFLSLNININSSIFYQFLLVLILLSLAIVPFFSYRKDFQHFNEIKYEEKLKSKEVWIYKLISVSLIGFGIFILSYLL